MTTRLQNITSRKAVLFILTFVVAFCSIVYELIYAEMLRVFYGGAATQYALNIGLFMFGIGVGSFLFTYLDTDRISFTHVEVALATIGPLGLLFIIWMGITDLAYLVFGNPTAHDPQWLLRFLWNLPYVLSYIPVITVGILSGFEIPYLTALADDEEHTPPGWFVTVVRATVAGIPFLRMPEDPDSRGSFSEILGMDYFGSLTGTVIYALLLYPNLGLIPSIFILGLLNAVAAAIYVFKFYGTPSLSVSDLVFLRFAEQGRAVFLACLILIGGYSGVVMANEQVEAEVSEAYLEGSMTVEWPSHNMQIEVREHQTTTYQSVTLYDRQWTGSEIGWWGAHNDTCLRLDKQIQLCDSWAKPYHHGLVDVPAQYYDGNNLSGKRVLLIGGGDWVAVNHLRAQNATVDMVDIDREFMNYTKDHEWFEQYHENAYEYDNLTVHTQDALTYLRNQNRNGGPNQTYDLVLLDVPGAETDEMLPLYSKEFYSLLNQHLTEDGLVVTWAYSRYADTDHRHAYLNTVRAAGFTEYRPYDAYADVDNDNQTERVEHYYILSPGHTPNPQFNESTHPYLTQYRERYEQTAWRTTPHYRGTDVNSLFDPNYDILVK